MRAAGFGAIVLGLQLDGLVLAEFPFLEIAEGRRILIGCKVLDQEPEVVVG